MRFVMLAAVAAAAVVTRSAAGQGSPSIARTFEIRAHSGMERAFESGYRAHLDWHVGAGDRAVWYLWEVTNGDRAGLYVDGTFGRVWSDFDHATDPAGDAADNEIRVEPLVTRGANHVWRYRADLSGATVDLETAPLVQRDEYRLRAGAESTFVAALAAARRARATRPYAVFELVSGGAPTFVVLTPARSWAELGDALQAMRSAPGLTTAGDAVASASFELWRFRPDLSICRSAVAGCHRTVR